MPSDLPPIAAPITEGVQSPLPPAAPAVVPDAVPAAPVTPTAPVDTPAPAEPGAPTAPELRRHDTTPTLLGEAKVAEPTPEAKPADPAPPETKPAEPEVKPVEQPTPEPVAYDFTFPEGVEQPKEAIEAATNLFREHQIKPDVARALVDRHVAEVQRIQAGTLQAQHEAFAKTREGWRGDIMSDPEIGGAGHRSAMAAAARMRDLLVPAADRAAFNDFLALTGAGDHPAMIRMLYRAARFFDAPQSPPPNPAPPPDLGRRPNTAGLGRLYSTMNGGKQ